MRKSSSAKQTPYGRRSTTMESLAQNHEFFSSTVLHAYIDAKFAHIAKATECKEEGTVCEDTLPPLPTTCLPDDPKRRPPRFAISNMLATNGKELHVNCSNTMKPYRSKHAFVPIYCIENRFPTLQSIFDEFSVSSVDDIDVWGIDPGKVNTAAFYRIFRDSLASIFDDPGGQGLSDITTSKRILLQGVEAKNPVVNRKSLYQPVFSHCQKMGELKSRSTHVSKDDRIQGDLWARPEGSIREGGDILPSIGDMNSLVPLQQHELTGIIDSHGITLPSINDMQNFLPTHQYESVEDVETSTVRFSQVQRLLHEFYGSKRVKTMEWELKKAKKAEIIDAILLQCTSKTLFCYANGSFHAGIILPPPPRNIQLFTLRAVSAGHVVVLVDEHLTSNMCPTYLESGDSCRLAKSTVRSCACLVCGRWVHRDIVGAHNIAAAGDVWIRTLTRPLALRRKSTTPSQTTQSNTCAETAATTYPVAISTV